MAPEQVHAQRKSDERKEAPPSDVRQSEHAKQAREDLALTDDLLDEIDALIEEVGVGTAESFVQKGGE